MAALNAITWWVVEQNESEEQTVIWREVCSRHLRVPVNNKPLLHIDLLYGNSTARDRSAEVVGAVLIMCGWAERGGGGGGVWRLRESAEAGFYHVDLDWEEAACPTVEDKWSTSFT